MDPTTISKFGKLEAAMSFRWVITLLSAIAFVDSYMIIIYGFGLANMTMPWVKTYLGLVDLISLITMFSITFGMILPGLGFVVVELWSSIKLRYRLWRKTEYSPLSTTHFYDHHPSYIAADDYRVWAIKNSNSAAYKDYEQAVSEWKDIKFMRYMSQCCIFLTLFSYILTFRLDSEVHNYYQVVVSYIESYAWYISGPLSLIIGYIGLFLLGVAFDQTYPREHYIHLKNHEIPPEE
ncbi:hypothetical protein [Photobacterium iliopiscarium]|uniref:hypothetical protein n=1 Tax=Photobacterium iliopiscarium TaxID=56192 RepID=UPI001E2A3671|nr:hypothetical protein [Photobacterium iliopiscarium]MCD9466602.1 hypothetical protein [Photobacterium iliopiscarium]MCD9488684.1 hypothetical protein [Photobacterium iliopiscarium]MCF2245408.1 hypothetical protein [Photobacterium iliopiscarium]